MKDLVFLTHTGFYNVGTSMSASFKHISLLACANLEISSRIQSLLDSRLFRLVWMLFCAVVYVRFISNCKMVIERGLELVRVNAALKS